MLFDADVLQIRRADVGWRGHDAFGHGLSPSLGAGGYGQEYYDDYRSI
jgi:hypothetical protein